MQWCVCVCHNGSTACVAGSVGGKYILLIFSDFCDYLAKLNSSFAAFAHAPSLTDMRSQLFTIFKFSSHCEKFVKFVPLK